jgi:Mrp family chromosome partitioning ATPase
MGNLIDELSEEADVVLFDTPPVLSVTDATVLGNQTDGTLFVVEVGKTWRDTLSQAISRIRNTNAQILGVLLNRI